jgi:adenylate cyclase
MIATVYMGLQEYEHTIQWLEKDLEEGGQDHFIWGLKDDIKFDPIRNDERFKRLLEVIK